MIVVKKKRKKIRINKNGELEKRGEKNEIGKGIIKMNVKKNFIEEKKKTHHVKREKTIKEAKK